MFARLDHCATGAANAICAKTVLKKHPLPCKLVYIWGRIDGFVNPVVGANCMRSVIISKDEDNVWAFRGDSGERKKLG